jgi:ATP-binding cassette, subfamily B, bacterial
MKTAISPYKAVLRSIGYVLSAAPKEVRLLGLINLAFGAGPALSLYLSKVVIDTVTSLTHGGALQADATSALWWAIAGFLVLILAFDSTETLSGFLFSSLRDRVRGQATQHLLEKVGFYNDVALFEDPDKLNLLQLAEKGIQRLQQLATSLGNLSTGLFILVPTIVLSFSFGWWIPLLLFAFTIPSIYAQLRLEQESWDLESAQADTVRSMNLYAKVLTNPEYSKDLRLFQLQPFFLHNWKSNFNKALDQMLKLRAKGALTVVSWSLLSALGAAIPYVFVVYQALNGRLTLGDLALAAGLIFQVRRSLFVLIANAGDIYEVSLGSSAFFEVLKLEARNTVTLENSPSSTPSGENYTDSGLVLDSVSFSYPGSANPSLSNISLQIKPGQMVVIVGENGAGKSTLAKLLCRLYDPEVGNIKFRGEDIRVQSIENWQRKIAVVFQDFGRFSATIRDNIAFGKIEAAVQDTDILAAVQEVGLKSFVDNSPKGLDTILGKQLRGGTDLSGGQWQRLAIARAVLRQPDAELLVLDEPTASLDPSTEHEVYKVFKKIAYGKICVIISHRLALAKSADQVVVLQHGKVAEIGPHSELMQAGGVYAQMYTNQASSYLEESAPESEKGKL